MNYDVEFSSQFKKDYKLALKQNKNISKLMYVIEILSSGSILDKEYKDHVLFGKYIGYRECHIENDWLLIYKIEVESSVLALTRLGTHANLFG